MSENPARCCWCKGKFVRVGSVYWCETPACRTRQADHSIGVQDARTGAWSYLYVPLPKQVEFECAPVRYLLGGGAAGASKSHMARWGLYRRALAVPGFEALILRKTWNELEKHHLRLMETDARLMQSKGIDAVFAKTSREFRISFPGGEESIIEGGHMENPDDVEKYLSRERDAIVCDEGSTFQPRPLLELSTRARSTKPAVEAFARIYSYPNVSPDFDIPGGGAVFWVLSNPGGPATSTIRQLFMDHEPIWEEYSEAMREAYRPSEWGYIPGNLEDNPYLPASYERDLAILQPWRYQQLRHNDWDILAGQYFHEFVPSVHVKDLGDPGEDVEWFRSLDWGYVNPGCCLWWACLPDGRYYIRAEYKFDHLLIGEVCDKIKEITEDHDIFRVRYTYADPSMTQPAGTTGESIQETFARCGVPLIMANNDRVNGWQRVREMLRIREDSYPTITIHPSCRYLIRTMAQAVSAPFNPEDVDTRGDDHALDALRYGAMSRPSPSRVRRSDNPNTFNAAQRRVQEHRRSLTVRA